MDNPIYFTLFELVYSDTAKNRKINNIPSFEQVENLRSLGFLLDIIRKSYGSAIKVNSGFRSPKLNSAVGGVVSSNHLEGCAADIIPVDGNTRRLFELVRKMIDDGEIEVGQLIWEKGTAVAPAWVHVSIPDDRHHNQVLYLF